MRYIILIALLFGSLFLIGCGESDSREVETGNLSLSVPVDWKESDGSLIDTDQTTFKILKAFKAPIKEGEEKDFRANIIVSQEIIDSNIDREEHFGYIIEKLKRNVIGAKQTELDDFSIDGVKVHYIKFSVNENILQDIEKINYFGAQLYIIEGSKAYMISLMAHSQDEIDDIFKMIKKSLKYNK